MSEFYGTEEVGGESARTSEERAGRCYSLAGYALAMGTAPDDAILVHGSIEGFGNPRIGHAWLQIAEDTIWEPMQARLWPMLAWSAIASPVVDEAYTQDEVRRMIEFSGTWGPWGS